MTESIDQSRRDLLKAAALTGGGLLLGVALPLNSRRVLAGEPGASEFRPNAWIRIAPDDTITLIVAKSEMGQGVYTSMPMLLAEELDVDLTRIRTETAPPAKEYVDPLLEAQATGGSTSVRASWQTLREAGAAARMLLIAAAAERWGVKPSSCHTENGAVVHADGKRRLRYGELADAAAKLPAPAKVVLKDPKHFRYLGNPVPRLDTPDKIRGKAEFGLDVRLSGMLTAVLAQCPSFGGTLKSVNADKAKAVPGVRSVVTIDAGVAVIADGYWPAKKGRDALTIEWDLGPLAGTSSETIDARLRQALDETAAEARRDGDANRTLAGAAKTVEAIYDAPFLAHAAMEPMNCTVDLKADRCDIWVGTQSVALTLAAAVRATGLPPEAIHIHLTYLGGGFGRRFEQEYVIHALQIAKQAGAPVKLIYSREDDIGHDFYRPIAKSRLRGGIDAKGRPIAWQQRIAGPSILKRAMPENLDQDGRLDSTSVEGSANLPYAIANLLVDYVLVDTGVPVGFWRSVGHSQNSFFTEGFIDEMAHAAGADPLSFRLELLDQHPRHRGVLKLAATKAGWGKKLPPRHGRGIAVVESFGSIVAEVAEVAVDPDGGIRVERVVCAVDCGQIVNPDTIEAQMEGAIIFALTATLKAAVTIRNGAAAESNFVDYPLLNIAETPHIEVHIVPSKEAPGGVGEPGVPPLAPAVANAVFAATGKRMRRLPFDRIA